MKKDKKRVQYFSKNAKNILKPIVNTKKMLYNKI